MILDEPDAVQAVDLIAALFGACGLMSVLIPKPSRIRPSTIVLSLAFAGLLVGGAMGVRGSPIMEVEWGERILGGGAMGLLMGAIVLVIEDRLGERARRIAIADSESRRREVERLGGTNVRLEDELQDVRRKCAALEKTGGAENDAARSSREAAMLRQRKALEASLASERRHRAVFDCAVEGMAMLERETLRLVAVNQSLVRMTGFAAADLAKLTLVDLFVPGPSQPGKSDLQRAAREARPMAVELKRKDGGAAYVDVSVAVIGVGADAQLLTIVREVSERRLLEQELQLHLAALKERERRLEDANRELADRATRIEEMNGKLQSLQAQKDHFVSTVSHELRTPLTSIRSFSEILLKHGDADSAVRREFLEIINKESERLTRLVNNLLDLARIESGEARLELSEFDARDVVADAAASMAGTAAERRVTIRRSCGDVMRPLFADRDKVQQLVMNLLGNAVKFSPVCAEIEVHVRESAAPGRVEILVVDHGPGIPQGELESVFEKFRRAGDASRGVPGTGLGLAICREIAKIHHGRIWAESVVGSGTSFRVELPGAEESRVRMEADRRAALPAAVVTAPARIPEPPPPKPAAGRKMPVARPLPDEDDRWTMTGTLPPLRIGGAVEKPSASSSTGELPPIR